MRRIVTLVAATATAVAATLLAHASAASACISCQ
jgi:hypothetical protein